MSWILRAARRYCFRGVLIFLSLYAPDILAEEFTDVNGRKYKGVILDQNQDSFYLDTSEGLINLSKSKVIAVDGVPYNQAEKPAPEQGKTSLVSNEPVQAGPSAATAAAAPESQYAVKVGNGGLTAQELSIYTRGLANLERHQKLSSVDWGTKDFNIRAAIEDEIVFQEALIARIDKTPEVKDSVVKNYQANAVLGDIRPQAFSEQEMKAFYNAHKNNFMRPAKYIFKGISGAANEINSRYEAIRSNPDQAQGWRQTGTMQEGDSFYLPLSEAQEKTIYALRKGRVSPVILDGMGMAHVFWCIDYQPRIQQTFDEALEKVRHSMIKERESQNKADFQKQMQALSPGQKTEDAIFDQAVKAGRLRERHTRDLIINLYLQKKKTTMGMVVQSVKEKYPVEIVS